MLIKISYKKKQKIKIVYQTVCKKKEIANTVAYCEKVQSQKHSFKKLSPHCGWVAVGAWGRLNSRKFSAAPLNHFERTIFH